MVVTFTIFIVRCLIVCGRYWRSRCLVHRITLWHPWFSQY